MDLSDVAVGNIRNNSALFSGGAIFADDSSSSLASVEYVHKAAENNIGTCFLQFGDEFTFLKVLLPVSMVRIGGELLTND